MLASDKARIMEEVMGRITGMVSVWATRGDTKVACSSDRRTQTFAAKLRWLDEQDGRW